MKKIWISFHGKYGEECQEFCFSSRCTKDELIGTVQRTFKIDSTVNIRLRNTNGCIVPINILTLETNRKADPYKIETWSGDWQPCRACSEGAGRCERADWADAWKAKLLTVESRVTVMENLIEVLSNKNSHRIPISDTEESVQNRIISLHTDLNELLARLDSSGANESKLSAKLIRSPIL